MLTMDLKARLKNPIWWVSVISAVAVIANYFGVDITTYIGEDWKGLIGSIFGFLAVLGITADTSTKGISDQVVSKATVVQVENTTKDVQVTASTTEINNTVQTTSQESTDVVANSKISVDNPDNELTIGQEVNYIAASKPQ